jgi:hypothetical protein
VALPVIVDDDRPVVVPGAVTIDEGDAGASIADVPLTLSEPWDQPVTVSWTTGYAPGLAGDQAQPTGDYTPASGTVTFQPGETAKSVPVSISGDTDPEVDEYLLLAFTTATPMIRLGGWGIGAVAIIDDD